MTKYTFLLPTFKALFLQEALESIENQSYNDYDVIVSDDCSPDDLKSIYNEVVGNDSRFAYRRNKANMGSNSLVSHWNMLLDMCDTEYLIMASDDDVYEPTFLEEIDNLIHKYPNVDVIRARVRQVKKGETSFADPEYKEYESFEEFLTHFHDGKSVLCLANYVFRTSALKKIGGFPDFPTAAFSDSAAAMALAKNGIAITRDILFSFRMSDENLSCAKNYQKNAVKSLVATRMFVDWYKDNIKPYINIQHSSFPIIVHNHKRYVENNMRYFLRLVPVWKRLLYKFQYKQRGYLK